MELITHNIRDRSLRVIQFLTSLQFRKKQGENYVKSGALRHSKAENKILKLLRVNIFSKKKSPVHVNQLEQYNNNIELNYIHMFKPETSSL